MSVDVRILSLKKIITPQTTKLRDILKPKQGDYVSFQDFQLINISHVPAKNTGEANWEQIYKTIKKAEKQGQADVRVCQRMVLHQNNDGGKARKFWNTQPPEILYISMLQLVNTTIDASDIQSTIEAAFSMSSIPANKWSLYYSMDYADIVLFTKNIDSHDLREVLRFLISGTTAEGSEKEKTRLFRDASTQIAVSQSQLISAFDYFDKQQTEPKEALMQYFRECRYQVQFLLEANLQLNSWITFVWEKLNTCYVFPETNKPCIYKTFGHHDIGIMFPKCSLRLLLYIVYLFEKQVKQNADESIGSYVFHILCESQEESTEPYGGISADNSLLEVTQQKLSENAKKLCRNNSAEINDAGCAGEIVQSLLVLLKGGFCEEFALCLLEPFAGYLGVVNRMIAKINQFNKVIVLTTDENVCKRQKIEVEEIKEDVWNLIRSFTQAVSLLAQSTMHNDGEFVYSPSFQTHVFDVPPKLLAMYQVAAHRIQELLSDASEAANLHKYYFLFNPDFRNDIVVEIISSDDIHSSNISIVFMCEELMYKPSATLAVLCHEIAHQVGSEKRQRGERTAHIFQCIALCLLNKTFIGIPNKPTEDSLRNDNNPPDDNSKRIEKILQTIAKGMGKGFTQLYEKTRKKEWDEENHTEGKIQDLLHYSKDVKDYLKKTAGLIDLFNHENEQETLFEMLIPDMVQEFNELKESEPLVKRMFIDDFFRWLYQTNTENTQYENENWPSAEIIMKALILAVESYGATKAWEDDNNDPTEKITDIVNAFIEAYADLRMIELLHIENYSEYLAIRKITNPAVDRESNLSAIRKIAIKRLLSPEEKLQYDSVEQKLIVESLVDYLNLCRQNEFQSKTDIVEINQALSSLNGSRSFFQIRNYLHNYRTELAKNIISDALK